MKKPSLLLLLCLSLSVAAYAQWTTTQHSVGRWYHGAAIVEGKLILAGGATGLEPTGSIEIYDIATDTWLKIADTLPVPRFFIGATVHGSKAYFAGGGDFFGLNSADIDVYDAITGTWSQMSLSEPKQGVSARTVGNKLIFAGGGIQDYPIYEASDLVEIYDTETGEWEYAQLSSPRMFMGSAVAGSKVFFAGGLINGDEISNAVDIYDAATGTWETATLSLARTDMGVAAAGDKVLFIGGYIFTDESDDIDIYHLETGAWEVDTYPQKGGLLAAASSGNRAYFIGGATSDDDNFVEDIYNTMYIFDGATNNWTLELMEKPRVGAMANALGNQVFISGGFNWDDWVLDLVEIYTDTATLTRLPKINPPVQASLYPNPAGETLTVQWDGAQPGHSVTLRVFNTLGRQVMYRDCPHWQPTQQVLDIRSLSPGVYSLVLERNGQRWWVKKFVVGR